MNILTRDSLRPVKTVSEVIEEIDAVEKTNVDEIGQLADLSFESADVVRFSGKTLQLTDTAKSQLGSMFGVKWQKWFVAPGIEPKRIEDELRLRLQNMPKRDPIHGRKLFRMRVYKDQAVLRGILSDSYCAIDDRPLMHAITRPKLRELFVGTDVRVLSAPWGFMTSDYPTHLTFLLDEPIEVGEGETKDVYYPAIHVGNSEVGRKAVTIEDALIRVVCVNGMLRVLEKRNLLYQAHRKVDFDDIYKRASDAVRTVRRGLPGLRDRILATHKLRLPKEEFEERIKQFIRKAQLPKSYQDMVIEAHKEEPEETMFGLIQALTLAAQRLSPEYAATAERHAAALI